VEEIKEGGRPIDTGLCVDKVVVQGRALPKKSLFLKEEGGGVTRHFSGEVPVDSAGGSDCAEKRKMKKSPGRWNYKENKAFLVEPLDWTVPCVRMLWEI